MSSPTVSIVLNSYNQADYLPAAIDSVLDQTFEDFELLLIDNGSTDSSPDILERYAGDPRIRTWAWPRNISISTRFNEGVAAARGAFISFLYADDRYLPQKLEQQVGALDRLGEEYGVVYAPPLGENERTGTRWRYGSIGESGDLFEALMLRSFVGQIDMCSPLIRQSCLLEHRFNESVFAEGEAIFFRIALTHRFAFLDDPVVILRDHGGNAGKAIKRNQQMTSVLLRALRRDPRMTRPKADLVDRYEARVLLNYGWQGARLMDDRPWVTECLRGAVRLRRRYAAHPRMLAGLGLVALPAGGRRRVNQLGHALRRGPGEPTYVDEYPGEPTYVDDCVTRAH
jgi:glycosyltransferase involved in cell wall biosynthesis